MQPASNTENLIRPLPPHSNERELVSDLVYFRETSRLACQIKLSEALDGLHLTIAPEE